MNASAAAQPGIPKTESQPAVLRAAPELAEPAQLDATAPRLPVWEERARKMGYPPSSR